MDFLCVENFWPGKRHPLIKNVGSVADVPRVHTRLKMVTGVYVLQVNRATFNQNQIDATCQLCHQADETIDHFLLDCSCLEQTRQPALGSIIDIANSLSISPDERTNLLQLILDSSRFAEGSGASPLSTLLTDLNMHCRRLCYKLHTEPYCNVETNERGLRLLEFATFNNLVLTNTLGPHKPSRRWTWHSPDGKHHNQIDYILVKKRFRSGVNIHRTRSFPGADIGSDHDLVMMTFQVRLKMARKPNQPRLRFDLEKLRNPDVACTFQATIGGKFAPLVGLSDEDMDMDTMITTYNTAVTDAASEILGKERRRKKPWVTKDVLDLCDERKDLKKKRYEAEGAKEYREANRRVQKAVKKAKDDWIGAKCEEIETCPNKNNSKRAYQLVKDLNSEKQGRSSTIQDKSGICLTEEKEILSRWTENSS